MPETDQIRVKIKIISVVRGALDKSFVKFLSEKLFVCFSFFFSSVHAALLSYIFPRPNYGLHTIKIFMTVQCCMFLWQVLCRNYSTC